MTEPTRGTLSDPTPERARKIRDLTASAVDHVADARFALDAALALARDDYDHNADKLQDIVGAIRLLSSTVLNEHHAWQDWAAARYSRSVR